MKHAFIVFIFSIGMLSGCAANRQPSPQVVALQQYVSVQLPLAREGKVKWSDYYSGLRDRQIDAGAPYEMVHLVSQLMFSAQSFEKGKITQEEFQLRQRNARAMQQDFALRAAQEEQARQNANKALALQYLASHPITIPQAQYTPIAPIQSQPAPALQLPQIQRVQTGVTAYWTGQQRQVQTVTNQFGSTCEYRYSAQTFWRTFVGSCPTSVQVQ